MTDAMLTEALYEVCSVLARAFAHQGLTGMYQTQPRLDVLFQLHGLLALVLAGKLSLEDVDLAYYRRQVSRLRLPGGAVLLRALKAA